MNRVKPRVYSAHIGDRAPVSTDCAIGVVFLHLGGRCRVDGHIRRNRTGGTREQSPGTHVLPQSHCNEDGIRLMRRVVRKTSNSGHFPRPFGECGTRHLAQKTHYIGVLRCGGSIGHREHIRDWALVFGFHFPEPPSRRCINRHIGGLAVPCQGERSKFFVRKLFLQIGGISGSTFRFWPDCPPHI